MTSPEDLDIYRSNLRIWCRITSFKLRDQAGKIVENMPSDLQRCLRVTDSDLDGDDDMTKLLDFLAV